MPMEVWRPGDYRVCPSCRTRHKVQDIECSRCKTVLVGTRVHRAAPTPVSVAGGRSSRGLRALVAAGLLVALGAGLWVQSVFRGAEIEDSVVAASVAAPVPRAAEPAWQPPVLSYPSMVGYNTGVPPSMAPLTIQEGPQPGAEPPATGMMSIAPSSEPLRQRAFTNEDLARVRSADGLTGVARTAPAPAVTALPAAIAAIPATRPATSEPSPAAPVPVAASAAVGIPSATIAETAARAVPSEEAKEWTSRLHDRQEDVQEAQAKVRRMEAQAEARRVQLGAAATEDARKKAERDLMDALDDLEKAERKLARAQRELDETHERAREKGVRLER